MTLPLADAPEDSNAARGRAVFLTRVVRVATGALLLGTALVVLGAWWLVPRSVAAREPDRPGLRAVLVDGSASATRCRPDWSAWARRVLRDECSAAADAGEELLVLDYGMDVAVAYGPGAPGAFRERLEGRDGRPFRPGLEPGRDRGSELARALEVAREALTEDGRTPGRVRLLSDGEATGRDPAPLLVALRRAGVTVEWIELPATTFGDLALRALHLPVRVEEGAPIVAAAELAYAPPETSGSELSLALLATLTGPSEPTSVSVEVDLPPDLAQEADGWVRWMQRVEFPALPPGLYRMEVAARLSDAAGRPADPVPANDRASRTVRVEGSIVCAVVASERGALDDWLVPEACPGVQLLFVALSELPAVLDEVDVLLSSDVGPIDLPRDLVHRFVMEGGGWLALGGWGFLRGWLPEGDVGDGELQGLLPLAADPRDAEARDVILLVDGSGSMSGEPFERVRAACMDLVIGALPRDRIELRFFTGALGPVVFESKSGQTPRERKRALGPLLAARVPRGPTDILYTLGEFAREREATATPGVALLLSDGHNRDRFLAKARELRRRLAAAGTKLSVLAVGERPDREFLASLLFEGEQLVDAGDLSDLARLLQREVNLDRVREGDTLRPLPADPAALAPGTVAADVLSAQLAAGAEWGALRTYARARLRGGAETLWTTSEDEPLLALQRAGLGLVACCATTPSSGWAPFLEARPDLMAPLLTALGRGRGAGEARVELFARGAELVLEGVPRDAPARIAARFERAPGAGSMALGRTVLSLPAGGYDPRTVRRAPRPEFLADLPVGEVLRVELETDPPRGLSFAVPTPLELSGGAFRVDRGAAPLDSPRRAGPAARSQSALGPPALALGLVLLAAGALARSAANQGFAAFGRRG